MLGAKANTFVTGLRGAYMIAAAQRKTAKVFMKSVAQRSVLFGIAGVVFTALGQTTNIILTRVALSTRGAQKQLPVSSVSKECTMLPTHALWLVSVLSAVCAESALPAQTAAPTLAAPAVKGTPRLASGHPCTLWDNQDVAAYRASFTKNPGLKAAFEQLRAWGNKRVAEPLNVPAHQLEADGTWTFPAFQRGYQDVSGKWNWEGNFNSTLQQRTEDVSNLGMLYALTGDENYAAFARQILLALADAYGHGKGSRSYGSQTGGICSTYHHNLWTNNQSRSPRLNGARSKNETNVFIEFII